VQEATAAGAYLDLAHVAEARPVVFLVVNRDATNIALMAHLIRASLPADRLRETYVYAGSPQDYLAERPTARLDGAPSTISQSYFANMKQTYSRDPVALVLGAFDDTYYPKWIAGHQRS